MTPALAWSAFRVVPDGAAVVGRRRSLPPGARYFLSSEYRYVLPVFSSDGGTVVPSPDGKRAMISSKNRSRDVEFDLATGRPLWSMMHLFDVGPFMNKSGKPVPGYFAAYGSYYLTEDQKRALRL